MSEPGNAKDRDAVSERDSVSEQGTVKWFSIAKGYGFIHRDGEEGGASSRDVFVHHSEVPGGDAHALTEGERVSFELIESDKGLQARHVVRAVSAPKGAKHP